MIVDIKVTNYVDTAMAIFIYFSSSFVMIILYIYYNKIMLRYWPNSIIESIIHVSLIPKSHMLNVIGNPKKWNVYTTVSLVFLNTAAYICTFNKV